MRWIVPLVLALLAPAPAAIAQGDVGAGGESVTKPLRPLQEALAGRAGPGPRGVDSLAFDLPAAGDSASQLSLAAYVPREGGPYPLVLFSHGLGMNERAYRELARTWSSHGYVVVLPRHEDQDPPESWVRRTPLPPRIDYVPNAAARARDLRRVLDRIETMSAVQPRLAGRIDPERVAVAGHSFGTLGAQLVGGARSSIAGLANLADDRVDAIVLFAAFGKGCAGFDESSWSELEAPLLAMTGSEDPGPFGGEHVERLAPALLSGGPLSYAFVLRGADHFPYLGARGASSPLLSPDRRAEARVLREERRRAMTLAKEGSVWAPGEMHFAALASVSRAFLDATLKDDESAARWIASGQPARDFAGLVERVSSQESRGE